MHNREETKVEEEVLLIERSFLNLGQLKTKISHRFARISKTYREHRLAYIFITPAVLAMTLLHFIPLVQGVWISLLRLNQFTLSKYLAAPFVGMENYYDVLFNPSSPMRLGFFTALRNTFFYTILVTIGTLGLGIIVSQMLNRNFKGRNIVRALFLFPWIIPTFVVGLLWGFMWQKSNGIINILLYDVIHIHRIFQLVGIPLSAEKTVLVNGRPQNLVCHRYSDYLARLAASDVDAVGRLAGYFQ